MSVLSDFLTDFFSLGSEHRLKVEKKELGMAILLEIENCINQNHSSDWHEFMLDFICSPKFQLIVGDSQNDLVTDGGYR